jgi:DNA-binding response OmpR family regulator
VSNLDCSLVLRNKTTGQPDVVGAATRKKRVAIVDDEVDIRDVCAIILEHLGYEIALLCPDAESLLEAIKSERMADGRSAYECDVILMDYHLGDGRKNGLDAAIEIRSLSPSVRITIITADDEMEDSVVGSGFQFLAKPFSIAKMKSIDGSAKAMVRTSK